MVKRITSATVLHLSEDWKEKSSKINAYIYFNEESKSYDIRYVLEKVKVNKKKVVKVFKEVVFKEKYEDMYEEEVVSNVEEHLASLSEDYNEEIGETHFEIIENSEEGIIY